MSLANDIAAFYDDTTALWESVWGEHLHHGHYGDDGRVKKDPRRAQVDLIEQLLGFGGVARAREIVDVGCGIGGSSFYLAERYHARVTGMTLSPWQAGRARERAATQGLGERVRFLVCDATQPPLGDAHFDLVWSCESAEHMADKDNLMRVFHRLLAPGGVMVMATWCRREPPPELGAMERRLLDGLCRDYHLPPLVPLSRLVEAATAAGLGHVRSDDWTRAVAPFWGAVARSALTLPGLRGLARTGRTGIKAALAIRHMWLGYRLGTIRFGVVTGAKAGDARDDKTRR